MRQHYKTDVKNRAFAQTANDRAHSVPGVAVETRLRAVALGPHYDRSLRRKGQPQLLRQRCESAERARHFINRSFLGQLDRNAFRVAVFDEDAIRVRADLALGKT